MLNSLKAKVIAGVCAAAVAGGGIAAGVIIANNAKKTSDSTTSYPGGAIFSSVPDFINTPQSGITGSIAGSGANNVSAPQPTVSISTPEPVLADWEYEEMSGGIRITKYLGNDDHVTVPSEIDGKKVLELDVGENGDFTFYDFDRPVNVKEIILPEGMTRIGYAVFAYLQDLEAIYIPDSVVSFDNSVFCDCVNLKSVHIPEGETNLNFTFENCRSLTEITIPESAEVLYGTFEGCTGIESIMIPEGVTQVEGTFMDCTSLKEVTFAGNNVMEIGTEAFCNCSELENINIPDEVDEICKSAFSGCTKLKNITLPDALRKIDDKAFADCSALENIIIPNRVFFISPSAFENCPNIKVTYKGKTYGQSNLDELYAITDGN